MTQTIALSVGRGTGEQLAGVFHQVLSGLAELHGTKVRIVRSPRMYHSYISLRNECADVPSNVAVERISELTRQDSEDYEQFCRSQAADGVSAVFRTAVNAQSLYLARERMRAVKAEIIGDDAAQLLLVRDQAQGFYTGHNQHGPGVITRTMVFRQDVTDDLIGFALQQARGHWPDGRLGPVMMAYKFHLLDGALDRWAAEARARHGVDIQVFQPDTVNRNLITHGLPPRTVLIAGNEWADIMHTILLDRLGSARQEDRYSRNYFLDPELAGFVEYQTVHGSADDLEGRDLVNPTATVRAAAAVAQGHVGCTGAVGAVEAALRALRSRGVATADAGGQCGTAAVVDALMAELRAGSYRDIADAAAAAAIAELSDATRAHGVSVV